MISLYLLTAHLIGDWIIQTDWMAQNKFDSVVVRTVHVIVYSIPFAPLYLMYEPETAILFLVLNAAIHHAIDTGRWVAEHDEIPHRPVIVDQILHLATLTLLGMWLL